MNDVVTFTSTATDKASTVSGWAEGDKIDTSDGSFNSYSYANKIESASLTQEIQAANFDQDSNKAAIITGYTTLETGKIYNLTAVTVAATAAGATTIEGYFANMDKIATASGVTKITMDATPTDPVTIGNLGLGSSESAILAIKASDSATGFWMVKDDDSSGTIDTGEVSLLGVVDGLAVGDVAAGTFAAGA